MPLRGRKEISHVLQAALEREQMHDPQVEEIDVAAYQVPTEQPESDGTLEWEHTTIVVVHVRAGGAAGLGYTYTDAAAATLIRDVLDQVVQGRSAMSPQAAWWAMRRALRNTPARGLGMFAISAVDAALWDLKARLLGLPLAALLGQVREAVPIYGSGGFTSYDERNLCRQLASWVEQGITRVKMKVGREPQHDPGRVIAARRAIGPNTALFIDANGAYSAQQAVRFAHEFAEHGVSWFEEPVSSDHPRALVHVRTHAPPGMDIAAGEYATTEDDLLALIEPEAADILQPDITRCGGVTGLLRIAALCGAHHMPISVHCAPALALNAACACREVRHMEYFFDHVRLETMLFEGVPTPDADRLAPDLASPGHGLSLRSADADRFRI